MNRRGNNLVVGRWLRLTLCALVTACSSPMPALSATKIQLLITGNLDGAVNECQCPYGQPGGLARRKALLDSLRRQMPNALLIDCGRLFRDSMSEAEMELLVNLMSQLQYDVVRPSTPDGLRRPLPRSWFTQDVSVNISVRPTPAASSTPKSAGAVSYTCIALDTAASAEARLEMDTTSSLTAAVILWQESQAEADAGTYTDHLPYSEGADIVIIGGGGFVEPSVKIRGGRLFVFPGAYGGWVLQVSVMLSAAHSIQSFEWTAHPTASVVPDPEFKKIIEEVYPSPSKFR